MSEIISFACASIALVAFCFTIRISLLRHFSWKTRSGERPTRQSHVYSDEDGDASAEPGVPRNRVSRSLIPLLALGALLVSGWDWLSFNFTTQHGIVAGGWVLVNIEAVLLTCEPSQPRRYDIGLSIAFSSLELLVPLVFDAVQDPPSLLRQALWWSQLALGACLAWASCSLARRPTVYHEGQAVDGQSSCSAAQRYSFAWVRPLLDQARTIRGIEYVDLPVLDYATRSQNLSARFSSTVATFNGDQPLWRIIVRDHFTAICRQWIIAIVESVVMMVPPLCLYNILLLLEERSPAISSADSAIWFWVICLAVSKMLHVGLENWMWWASFALFEVPVRSQLSAVIFAKSLQMKLGDQPNGEADVKPAGNSPLQPTSVISGEDDALETDPLLPQTPVEDSTEDEAEEAGQVGARGIVNLLGVDVQRFSDFCAWNVDLIRGLVKVILAAAFLVSLLGWWSTLAGFAVPVILTPLNRVATKAYSRRQLEVMAARDNKAHVVTEALHGIRQIKFSATETQWETRILKVREAELRAQWSVYVWGIFLTFVWISMPALIGAAALSVYASVSKRMIASVAFTALSIFSSLEWTISAVPTTITEMLDARVSADRIQQHLNSEERAEMSIPGDVVQFRNTAIAWPSSSQSPHSFVLRDVNLRFPSNGLSVIHGKTGTGKSLLLAAIIGEADIVSGDVQIPQAPPMNLRRSETVSMDDWIIPFAFAFVSQVPWIENTSVKNAILFGLPYRHGRYMEVLHACALLEDIKMLPDGEDTEIGATGINLSGGQRWRLTFARALYSRAGVLVLDDIFSAVDSHVGRHLLEYGILGPLGSSRTKILVTHHVGLVERHAGYLVTLHGDRPPTIVDRSAETSDVSSGDGSIPESQSRGELERGQSPKTPPRKFVEDEKREQGRVKWSIYKTYILASGGQRYWLLTLALFSLGAFSTVARSYWLSLWTKSYTTDQKTPSSDTHAFGSSSQPQLVFYLGIYILLSLISVALVGVKIIFVMFAALRAARRLFEVATLNVLRAPLRWLDTEPVGRILNRFVGDFALIDSKLGGDMNWCANGLFSVVTIVAAALFVSLWMTVPVIVLLALCLYVVYLYLDAARDIRRLESSAKSPVFQLVGSTLSGLATVRSFGRTEDYLLRMYEHIDRYCQTTWYVLLSTQWMRFRQGLLGVVFTLCIAVGVAYFRDIDASLAGFALSFALDFSTVAEGTIRRYTSTELDMNSTERVLEYVHLETEPLTGSDAAPSWPSKGDIVVRNLEVGYAAGLGSVLRGISFSVVSRDRIGIVGRTGSGKSSLTLALFRFLEARQGSIEIDGVDIATLKLHDLRSQLAIIPQDPVLFSGTLRSNLDPFEKYTDAALLAVLQRVNLINTGPSSTASTGPHCSNIFKSLSSPMTQGGSNLSQGEKQLVCLARAIVTRPKILVLDEATSAVDMETDALIQRSIREEFHHSTLLVVAHRLSTVADFDKILVLSDGRVAEYDRPDVLARRKGLFWKMLEDSGEKEALRHLLE